MMGIFIKNSSLRISVSPLALLSPAAGRGSSRRMRSSSSPAVGAFGVLLSVLSICEGSSPEAQTEIVADNVKV